MKRGCWREVGGERLVERGWWREVGWLVSWLVGWLVSVGLYERVYGENIHTPEACANTVEKSSSGQKISTK